jgi:sulfite reductase (NADPH) hemoprotein beta-component
VTHAQNIVLAHVRQDEVHALWRELAGLGLDTPNGGLITDAIACPGLDYCSLANARAIPVAQRLSERFADLDRQHDIGTLHVNISGCINACGHHHVGHIGLLGVDKKGVEYYQITLGGSATNDAALGEILGPAFSYDDVVDAVERVVQVYLDRRETGEDFKHAVRRLGLKPFQEALYATA